MSRPPTMAIGTSSGSRCAIRCGQRAAPSGGGPAHMPSLCLSSGAVAGRGLHDAVEAPGDGALDAAPDVAVCLALGGAPGLVSAGFGVAAHSCDRDGVQCPVQGAVTAAVEAVLCLLAAAGFQRRDASQAGEGGLVPNPAGVRPADQHLGSHDRSDAGLGEESGAGGMLPALLRLVGARHTDAPPWAYGQIAKASSSNATANRRCTGSSTASSYRPRRRFCTNACPAITILALRSCLSPRIGPSRAFSRPWSASTRLLAYRSVRCKAAGSSSSTIG